MMIIIKWRLQAFVLSSQTQTHRHTQTHTHTHTRATHTHTHACKTTPHAKKHTHTGNTMRTWHAVALRARQWPASGPPNPPNSKQDWVGVPRRGGGGGARRGWEGGSCRASRSLQMATTQPCPPLHQSMSRSLAYLPTIQTLSWSAEWLSRARLRGRT